jgi:hypothetical protein
MQKLYSQGMPPPNGGAPDADDAADAADAADDVNDLD